MADIARGSAHDSLIICLLRRQKAVDSLSTHRQLQSLFSFVSPVSSCPCDTSTPHQLPIGQKVQLITNLTMSQPQEYVVRLPQYVNIVVCLDLSIYTYLIVTQGQEQGF